MPSSQDGQIKISGRPTWAEKYLDNLVANFQKKRNLVSPTARVMAVVKADAYGHGAVECARRLAKSGADWFGVAIPEEAIQLRATGITQPILSLGGFWPGQAAACIQNRLTPMVYRLDMLESLNQAALDAGTVIDAHVKIDTDGRLGVRFDQLSDFVSQLDRFRNVRIDGLMSHLAAADDASCKPLTLHQIHLFQEAASVFRQAGYHPTYLHLSNSAGIYGHRDAWGKHCAPRRRLIRFVARRFATNDCSYLQLAPVMSLHSRISMLKWVPPGETIGYGCTFEASRKSLIAQTIRLSVITTDTCDRCRTV